MPRVGEADREVAVAAVALINWHATSPHCGRCGALTDVTSAGLVRHCPACGRDRFPRSDPAIIVAIVDAEDRLLLGHQAVWPTGRMSILAGFVSAGESLEQAVYGFDDEVQSNTLDSHVSRLRRKLTEAGAQVEIHAIRGVGYLLKAAS
jgi:predicted  nucleic acid-binding Zn-ribbon protein